MNLCIGGFVIALENERGRKQKIKELVRSIKLQFHLPIPLTPSKKTDLNAENVRLFSTVKSIVNISNVLTDAYQHDLAFKTYFGAQNIITFHFFPSLHKKNRKTTKKNEIPIESNWLFSLSVR